HQPLNFGRAEGNKDALYARWKKNPSNFIVGVSLLPFLSVPRDSAVIGELMKEFGNRQDAPNSLYLLAARVAAENQQWEESWRCLEIYLKRKR
ncbi:MAG: hypothetical protein ABI615_13075, partial [Chthoniobacterales bacterium]